MTAEAMDEVGAAVDDIGAAWPSPAVAWYAVFVFALSLLVNFLDRGILNLLVQPIKHDLHLSDTQFSLVTGVAFAFFYVLLGLPIARLADRGNRKVLISVGLGIWSVATALCGLARNFGQLFAFRVGVGVGEACTGPATFSMLSDLFPKHKLPRAIAVMNFGFIAGSGVASIVGGLVIGALSQRPAMVLPVLGLIHPWQMTFFVVGIPGLIVALMMATVPEPVRRGRMALAPGQAAPASIPIRDVLKFLFTHGGTYGPLLGGLALHTLMTFGMAIWMPAFYIRHFHWTPTRYGLVLGLVSLAFAPLGAMFGSWLAERWAKQGKDDANMRIVVWSSLLTTPVAVLLPLMPTASLAVAFAIINSFIGSWVLGPQNAAMQIITPNQMRGQVTALYLFMFNVIGFGLGPTVVALITNQVFSEAQVGYSLATTAAIFGPISTLVIFIGLKAYGRSVALARQWDRSA